MTPSRRRLAALALPALAWLVLAAVALERADRFLLIDFNSFYVAARAAGDGIDVYDTGALQRLAEEDGIGGWVFPYLYPPPLAYLGRAWGALDPAPAQRAWLLLQLAAGLAAVLLSAFAALAARRPDGDREGGPWVPMVAAAAGVGLLRFYLTLDMGQVNLLVLAFIALAVWLFFRRRDTASGAALAVAVLIKVSPAVLLIYAVACRRWRVVGGFAAGAAGIALATLPFGAFGAWQRFFAVLPERGHGSRIPGLFPAGFYPNFSFAGWLSRLFGDRPGIVAAASGTAILVTAALLVLAVRRMRGRRGEDLMLLPFLVLMILASPYAYIHHTVYLLPGLVVLVDWLWQDRRGGRRLVAVVAVAALAAAAGYNFPLLYEGWTLPAWAMRVVTSVNLYLLLTLLALATGFAVRSAWRTRSVPELEPEAG